MQSDYKNKLTTPTILFCVLVIFFANVPKASASCAGALETCNKTAADTAAKVVCEATYTNCINNPPSGGSSGGADYGLHGTAEAASISTSGDVAKIIGKVIGVVLSFVGVAFFVLMLYGGFLWMTARGDETQATKARNIIIDAIIGIIIVTAAGIITTFIFSDVVNFK